MNDLIIENVLSANGQSLIVDACAIWERKSAWMPVIRSTPDYFLHFLAEENWRSIIREPSLNEKEHCYVSHRSKSIHLMTNWDSGDMEHAWYHEMGHIVDTWLGKAFNSADGNPSISSYDIFIKRAESERQHVEDDLFMEKWYFLSGDKAEPSRKNQHTQIENVRQSALSTRAARELFAELFSETMTGNYELAAQMPQTFQFVRRVAETLEESISYRRDLEKSGLLQHKIDELFLFDYTFNLFDGEPYPQNNVSAAAFEARFADINWDREEAFKILSDFSPLPPKPMTPAVLAGKKSNNRRHLGLF